MKNYFSFNLSGRKLLPIWIVYMLLVIVPYVALTIQKDAIQTGSVSAIMSMFGYILIAVAAYLIMFYIVKLVIENVAYKEKLVVFDGAFGKYIGKVLLGFFLSIVTLGIYAPWFVQTIMSFYIDNSSYNSSAFKFKGDAGKLFVILLLTLILPMLLLSGIVVQLILSGAGDTPGTMLILQLAVWIIMIPYVYLVYKWMVNIDYKGFTVSWKTNFWNSCGKIVLEMILTMITVGVYWPLAIVRLYKYFAEKTFADSDVRTLQFGYDIDQLNDFLYIWGQTLLTLVTLGIYYPWAFSKVGSRMLAKTYLMEVEPTQAV